MTLEHREERSAMFRRIREEYGRVDGHDVEQEEAEKFTLLETGIRIDESELTATQRDILTQARLCGFEVDFYASRVLFAPVVQKTTTDKTEAGTITSPEKEVRPVFIDARFPKSVLAFKAGWAGKTLTFTAHVSDPVGQYQELTCGDKMRQVEWMITGSKLFQGWLDQWRLALTGVNKVLEKSTEAEEKAMRASLRQMKKEIESGE